MSKRRVSLIIISCLLTLNLSGCVKPYNTPEFVEISPSQTAFLVPIIGDSTNQSKFESEEMLQENLVAAKRIQIPKQWVKTGRFASSGEYMNSAQVIIVERKPVTREWTESNGDGTSSQNQSITAETKESIAFMTRMSITANIKEEDAAKFLYNYNTKTLEEIMDTEIRATVESKFNEKVAKYELNTLLENKEEIMSEVRSESEKFFKEKGITISTLGLKGELTYLNPEIQKSIDAEFKALKEKDAQEILNKLEIDKAIAEKEVIEIQSSTLSNTIKLKEAEAKLIEAQAKLEQAKAMSEWDVKVLGDNPILAPLN